MKIVVKQMIPLAEFIADRGRLGASKLLGCTGPALANALRAGRTIFVEQGDDGATSAVEISKFPNR